MYYSRPNVNVCDFSAHITRNRNRSKIYGDTVYLKNGETFEIELFNPSTTRVLVEIKINGKKISQGGIILRPGERVYLERFIESNKKFLFETYEIEKSNEALNAIKDNGMIEISFYTEQTLTGNNSTITINYPYYTSGLIGNNGHLGSTASNISFGGTTQNNLFTATSTANANIRTLNSTSTIETGRIEMGDTSNQKFNESYGIFNTLISKNIKYRILPESQKPLESTSIRNYCTDCGVRMKKQTWKFCPNCGSKF